MIYGKGTSRVLDLIEHGCSAVGIALTLAGIALALAGRGAGLPELPLAAVFAGVWLLVHLYRGRYRL